MRKTCILHTGIPKTGTTSLQATLFRNREALLKIGINYFKLAEIHHNVTQVFDKKDKSASRLINYESHETADITKAALLTEIKRNKSKYFVISAESLGMLRETDVKDLKDFLSPHFDDFKIITYVRDPYSFASSAAQQLIKAGATSKILFENTLKKTHPGWGNVAPNYTRRIRPYMNIFGKDNVIVRDFTPSSLYNGDVVDDFFHTAFAYNGGFKTIKKIRENDSFDRSIIKVLEALNEAVPSLKNGSKNTNRSSLLILRLMVFSKTINNEKYIAAGLDLEELDNVLKEDVNWLKKNCNITFDKTKPKWGNAPLRTRKIALLVNFLSRMIDREQNEKALLNHHIQLLKGNGNKATFNNILSKIDNQEFLRQNILNFKEDGFHEFASLIQDRLDTLIKKNSTDKNNINDVDETAPANIKGSKIKRLVSSFKS